MERMVPDLKDGSKEANRWLERMQLIVIFFNVTLENCYCANKLRRNITVFGKIMLAMLLFIENSLYFLLLFYDWCKHKLCILGAASSLLLSLLSFLTNLAKKICMHLHFGIIRVFTSPSKFILLTEVEYFFLFFLFCIFIACVAIFTSSSRYKLVQILAN